MKQNFEKILAFLSASALECVKEPSPYGALRMMEAIEQLLLFAVTNGIFEGDKPSEIAARISAEKGTALTDRDRFMKLVEDVAVDFVDGME